VRVLVWVADREAEAETCVSAALADTDLVWVAEILAVADTCVSAALAERVLV